MNWNLILNVFGVFAKFWEAGTVKTRLAKSIGFESAAEVYFQFLKSTLLLGDRIESNQNEGNFKKTIGFSPQKKLGEFSKLAPTWTLLPQVEGNLGRRMKCFFDSCFARSGDGKDCRVVLIGSDTPALPGEIVSEAFQLLKHNDVVLGPSFDGGYYLIGCRDSTPEIFENINWSTPQVCEQTVTQLNKRNYQYALLEKHNDVDELTDLRQLRDELSQRRDNLPPHQIELQNFLSNLNLVSEI